MKEKLENGIPNPDAERTYDTPTASPPDISQDFDSLAAHISQGLARCEIICNANGEPVDYRILSANKAFERHTGIHLETVIGKTILEVYPDIERSWISTYGRVALTQKTEVITGYNHNTKRHYRSTAYSDKPGEFMMLFEDTTQQKELEKAHDLVSKSTKFSADIVDNMSIGYKRGQVIVDADNKPYDFRILQVNDAYASIFGKDRHELQGRTMLEVFPKANPKKVKAFGEVALSGEAVSLIDICDMSGKIFDISIFSPLRGEFVMFIKDITEREQSRIELAKANALAHKSTKLSSDLLQNMPEGFKHAEIICDKNGNPIDFKILEVNASYSAQTGIDTTDYVGKTMLEVFPDVEKSWINVLGEVALTGVAKHIVDYNHNTGKYFQITAFCPKRGEFALFIRDVTEREQARMELEAAYKKVEESERLKTTFLANMSHEIRTPLNAILGFAELLEDRNLEEEDESKCLENIKSSGNRLLNIVSDILEISKLEANQQQLKYATHNLNSIVEQLYEQFKVINIDPKLAIGRYKDLPDAEAYIETDATRLEQILSNLLENALKHTKKGEIEFGYHLKKGFLEFFVKDTGKGIKKADQPTIFKRFGQINNKPDINQGTGLGIPIASAYTELFGGKMWLESKINKGSTFFFSIPHRPVVKQGPKTGKPTILIAEDEEANFLLLELWLKKHCQLIRAHDGHETVRLAKTDPNIDLVLMDIKMPYLNGIEATKEIRKTNKELPIIAQTAFIMDNERSEILEAGSNEIVSKPIKREVFKKLLTQYIPRLKFA
ncbi:ATP-binding protein [Flagellimonas sp. DF-77]|uniref:ATP-binding protein n=1 Tax=Flagellimonas algarum TaxID=3230298 RepID=UPI003393F813